MHKFGECSQIALHPTVTAARVLSLCLYCIVAAIDVLQNPGIFCYTGIFIRYITASITDNAALAATSAPKKA